MTPITWPASLPCLRWEPYSVSPRPGSLEETLGMITNLSRVYAANNEVVSAECVLDAADEPTFRTFYKTTLAMGTQWFNLDILRNGVYENYELLFIGPPPVFTPIAHNVVRASFTLLTRGEPQEPGPEPVLEYDPIVLARNPSGYWRLDETSGAVFNDLSGNGLHLVYSGAGLVYSQGDILTDPGGSIGNTGGLNFRMRVPLGTTNTGPDAFTVAGWIYLDSALIGVSTVILFHIGGSSGAAQITKAMFSAAPDGSVSVFWHEDGMGAPTIDHTVTFPATTVPFDTPFYYSAGQRSGTTEWFFKLNDQAADFVAYGADTPWQIPGRQTYFHWAGPAFSGSTSRIRGKFARAEYYAGVALTNLDMWTDWHL